MQIEKQIDNLTIERWRFIFLDKTLYLDGYTLLQRDSLRHKNYKVVKNYDRIMSRDNTIQESEVPFTDDIKTEALNQFISTIKVIKWSER